MRNNSNSHKYHKWKGYSSDTIERCLHCNCNRIKSPHPILYVYYYDGYINPIIKKPNCTESIKSNSNKLT